MQIPRTISPRHNPWPELGLGAAEEGAGVWAGGAVVAGGGVVAPPPGAVVPCPPPEPPVPPASPESPESPVPPVPAVAGAWPPAGRSLTSSTGAAGVPPSGVTAPAPVRGAPGRAGVPSRAGEDVPERVVATA